MLIRTARRAVSLCVALAFLAVIANGCVSEEPCECIRSYGKTGMSSAEIKRLLDTGITACFALDDKNALEDEGRCLPTIAGTDARNGQSIEIVYGCSDVCPDAGHIFIRYSGVTEADCCGVGGTIAKDWAWGGFMGCMPPEVEWSNADPCP
jgi:hypothetical protein